MKKPGDWIQQCVFIGPSLIFFSLIVIIPFLFGMYYSFTDWNGISMSTNWIGVENFRRVFTDEQFLYSLWFTLKFTFASVLLMNFLGLFLAYLLTKGVWGTNMFRTIFFIPHIIGGLILGFIWQFIFTKGMASLGQLIPLSIFNLPWLGTENTAFWALVIVITWQMCGYLMIIYIAGIINVPKETLEAAEIDGSNAWQKFRYVTLPLIMPSVTICYFLAIATCFKIFDVNLSLTAGGPFNSSESLALNIYQEAFSKNRYGLGIAKALLFFILVGLVTTLQIWITKRKEVEA